MNVSDVRKKYLEFFEKKGHEIVPSSSLLPENDPTTLFTGSGMQPMIQFFLGAKHPMGSRIVNSQKCFRAEDINEVGDNRHTTFFEMLGNWSFGDYFKEEQLPFFFEFLTDVIGLEPKNLYVSVFSGAPEFGIPKDEESVNIWKKLFQSKGIEARDIELVTEALASSRGMQGGRIFYYKNKNWWSRAGSPEKMPIGEPGGPDSEVFYEFTDIEHNEKFGNNCHPNCDCGRFLEIGNSVFMEYFKDTQGSFKKLAQRNVDFGGGLERIAAVSQNCPDIFKIDVFNEIIEKIESLSGRSYADPKYNKSMRIIADHVRAAAFIIADGVLPSNTEQGYFVRRLIRRAMRHGMKLSHDMSMASLATSVVKEYESVYEDVTNRIGTISDAIKHEEEKFQATLKAGMKEFEKLAKENISGTDAFILFSSYGFPIDMTIDLANEMGISVDVSGFEAEFAKHQKISRAGAEKKFKGGLADTSEMSIKYHTATHLLHQALRDVLGNEVCQKGSNITAERLRFDFSFGRRMTEVEKQTVEDIVNNKIAQNLPVNKVTLPLEIAKKSGALHFFDEKYPDEVLIHYVGNSLEDAYSKEFCGGPHVLNTSELGEFKIIKEEAISQGIRRIKAVLE